MTSDLCTHLSPVTTFTAAMALIFSACGGSTRDAADTASNSADVAVDSTATDLIGCESNIAQDVPLFYAPYFRCTDISLDGETAVISSDGRPGTSSSTGTKRARTG